MTENALYLPQHRRPLKCSFGRPAAVNDILGIDPEGASPGWSAVWQNPPLTYDHELPGMFWEVIQAYVDRPAVDVLSSIVASIGGDEKESLRRSLHEAVDEAVNTGSLHPLAQMLRNWEATVEINADPLLSVELHEALEEYDTEPQRIPL